MGPRLGGVSPRWFTLASLVGVSGDRKKGVGNISFGYRIIGRDFMEVSVFFQLSSVWARLFSVAVFVRVS